MVLYFLSFIVSRADYWRRFTNVGLGRLVRVILVAVVCDKPAAHKMGGFASHSHNHFCTLCWISAQDKARATAFQDGGE
jgi:hypothetical protein